MSTIKEIAKACDVSVATVSNIINNKGAVSEKTKQRVLKVIEKMNYTPNSVAKNLKMKNTRSIGVIAEDMTVFTFPDILDGITEYCEKKDYQILFTNLRLYKKYSDTYYHNDDYSEIVQKEFQKLCSKQVEGIIYVAAHERQINVIPDNLRIPVVVAYGFVEREDIPSVVVDDMTGAMEVTGYMASRGHKRIGVLAGKRDSLHTQSRLEGYQRALFQNHILYNPNLIVHGDWDRESGYKKTGELIEKGVTAIFCMNDIMAGGTYDRLYELGLKAGKDIAVAGYDNREIASYERPPLTTVGLPLHDIGYKASELIMKMLENRESGIQKGLHYVSCELFIRESVQDITDRKE